MGLCLFLLGRSSLGLNAGFLAQEMDGISFYPDQSGCPDRGHNLELREKDEDKGDNGRVAEFARFAEIQLVDSLINLIEIIR